MPFFILKFHNSPICNGITNLVRKFRLSLFQPSIAFHRCDVFRNQLNITSIVKHTANSLCEGFPVKYRVIMDQYLGFVPLKESIFSGFVIKRAVTGDLHINK